MRERPAIALIACTAAVAVGACGGGERQDKDEPEGDYQVEVVRADFPKEQKLAKRSELVIAVENTGDRDVPNLAVTVDSFDYRKKDPTLADPERPVFVVNSIPRGTDTAYVDTFALGRPLPPGETATMRWDVTAVKAGRYRLAYKVAAGLSGKAKAVDAAGQQPEGVFVGRIKQTPPRSRVADDGKTVVDEDGKVPNQEAGPRPKEDEEPDF